MVGPSRRANDLPFRGRVALLVVALEEIAAEVVLEVAPQSVRVVRSVLRVVVLDHEMRSMQAPVVRLAALRPAAPRTADLVDAVLLHSRPFARGGSGFGVVADLAQ